MKDALRIAWLGICAEGQLVWVTAPIRALGVLLALSGLRIGADVGGGLLALAWWVVVSGAMLQCIPAASRCPTLPASQAAERLGRALGVWAPAALGLSLSHLLLAVWPTEALVIGRHLTEQVWPGSPDVLWPWLLPPEAVHVVEGRLEVARGPSPVLGLSLLLGLGLALQAGDLRLYAPAMRHGHDGLVFASVWRLLHFLLQGIPWAWAVTEWHAAPWTAAGLLSLLMGAMLISARLRPVVWSWPWRPERKIRLVVRPFRTGGGAWARDVAAGWAGVARPVSLLLMWSMILMVCLAIPGASLLGLGLVWVLVPMTIAVYGLAWLVAVPLFGVLSPLGLTLDGAGPGVGSGWDLLPVSRVRVLGVTLIGVGGGAMVGVALAAVFTPWWLPEGTWRLPVALAMAMLTVSWVSFLRVPWVRYSQQVLAGGLALLLFGWAEEPLVASRLLVLQAVVAALVGLQVLWRRP